MNKIACQEFLTPRLVIIAWFLPTKKLDLNGISNGNNTVTYENFQKFDEQSLRNNISSQSLENLYAFSNPNEMRQVWKHTILAKANNHAPLRTNTLARSSPWITPGTKGPMHKRYILKIKPLSQMLPMIGYDSKDNGK